MVWQSEPVKQEETMQVDLTDMNMGQHLMHRGESNHNHVYTTMILLHITHLEELKTLSQQQQQQQKAFVQQTL